MGDLTEPMEPQDQDKIEKAHYEAEEIDRLVDDFLARQTSASENRGDIVFEDLSVIGAGIGHQLVNNVPEACMRLFKLANPARWSSKPAPSRVLLRKLTGSIREGEMLMVVGRPGSGCTTFLKALANMREEYLAMEGKVWYGSLDAAAAKKNRPHDIAFVGENDVHFPTLSVSTTLRFALNARRGTSETARASSLEQDLQTVLQLMGLDHAAGVRIGNDHIRGVSGGQRRRVSLAEAFCTRASLFCLDNPTRGLDSSTAIRFLTVLRKYTTRSGCATAMSLYQASDLAVSLFDKILVLNEGRVAYYGPASSAKEYFESLGFYCSSRTSISDFLASMSGTPDGRLSREDIQRPVPLHPADFEARFWESSFYQEAIEKSKAPQHTSSTIKPSGYALPFYRQVYECTIRHYRIFMTDRAAWIAEAAGTIVQALLLGTLFRNQRDETEGLYTRCSALFFCVLIMGLQASAEFGNTFVQRPILLKQKSLGFYRPGAYALGQILADVPWKLIFILYSLPIYWMIDFQRTAGHFFTWLVCLYMGLMALSVMFRAIAVFTTSITRAILPVGLLLNVLIIYTGFYITPPGMKVWLGWIRYLDVSLLSKSEFSGGSESNNSFFSQPMYYIFESIALNEIGDSAYQCSAKDTVPVGLSYNDTSYQTCAMSGSLPGHLDLSGKLYLMAEYGFHSLHKWRNVGINAAFFLFFSVLVTIGMERFRHAAAHMSTIYYRKLPWTKTSATSLTDIETPPLTNEIGKYEKTSESESAANHFEPNSHTFAWQDLTLDLGNGKRLLDNPGSMTALMGMSGAGKTTLLDALAQRIQIGVLSGGLYLDGGPLPASMGRRTGFVHQNDIHLDSSTVREALQLSARLRRPSDISLEKKMAHVEMVISLLDMEDIADAVIGVPGAGLDLERRKRVSIGVELAAKPDILLFLDEPTSGLDGNSALSIVQLMRKLSHAGQTILCTIHQPSSQMIEQFDSLLILIPGGKTMYFGPLGHQCRIILDYFARYTRRCNNTENPADYLLDVSADSQKDWFQIWQHSPEFEATKEQLQNLKEKDVIVSAGSDRAHAASYLEQLQVVTQRAFTNYWRDSDYVLGKIQLNIWMGLMNGLTFLQLSNDLTDSRGRMFSIFVGVITGPVLSLQIEPRFIILRDQFLARENESHVYHWSVFTISALLVEIPFTLLGGLIYWLLWYYMVGYFTISTSAGYAFLMYELYSLFVASLAQFTAAIFPTTLAAQVATGFVWLVVNTFNGPLSPPPLTPRGWRWFYNISPLYYFIEGIGSNAMHALEITCRSSELSVFITPTSETCGSYAAAFFSQSNSTGYLVDTSATGQCEYCSYANGDQYIKQYDFSYSQRGRNVGIFIGFILFNYTMAIVATYSIFIFKWRKRSA
ncbi:hypothetical protein N7520_005908 [Penicillium odoratum]|uniref:uncharacterized protein n=1 Tax=Penicillium odoratum TaxID=1167516 RepID=UPI0025474427|nr:uncharacterized protein N7520_005908 [Penicillium odoratum]KAJ5758752.1 hypothetical protein N7520_005908 [Penicillium odoratum]